MHVERLDIDGFRNCCESVTCDPALTLLLGENNAGKTNIVDALRLALVAEAGSDRLQPQLSDFARGADGKRTSEEFAITAVVTELSVVDQGLLSVALAPKTEGYGKARIGLRARIGADDEVKWFRCGGDFDSPDVEQRALNAVHHTYLPPLRDAGSDLQPGRTNRLARLLHVLTPERADRDALVELAQEANEELARHPKVRRAVEIVQGILNGMTLEGHRQTSDIAFADAEFSALVRQLLARLGETWARELAESGLGYQNLLYMAVLLAHLEKADARDVPLRVLLIEEPEAHLHPQLQDLLLRYLQGASDTATKRQVIVTSNSPQFAAAAELNRLVVITRPRGALRAAAHAIRDITMEDDERAHVRRFLDVTKAALFFARGVIFVEGVSEQLLVPYFARMVDRDLADSGVTVINIGGVAFSQFARLFGEGALPIPCAILSDGDADPTEPNVDNPRLEPKQRGRNLLALRGGNVDVFLADVTLEWDLARAQPRDSLLAEAMCLVHPQSGSELVDKTELSGPAWATLFRAKLAEKAVFAQELAARLEADSAKKLVVPGYIKRAIKHATTPPPRPEPDCEPAEGGA